MTDRYAEIRAAINAAEPGDIASVYRFNIACRPGVIRALLADADRAAELEAENARLREALRWTAGSLQAACVASKINETDKARALIGTESRTVGQILDAANAALAQEQGEKHDNQD